MIALIEDVVTINIQATIVANRSKHYMTTIDVKELTPAYYSG